MDLNARKELFSEAYVKALSAVCGCNYSIYKKDDDSIDIGFTKKGLLGTGQVYSPKIDIQMKCTENLRDLGEHFSFPLSLKNYDDLRVLNASSPRILVVQYVPENVSQWVDDNNSNYMILRYAPYWLSLRGQPESANETSETVHLPKAQRLTIDALNNLFVRAGSGAHI